MDESAQYQAEWDQAQQRYQAGVNAGYSDADAEQMYIAPVREKWNVLKSVPDSMKQIASRQLDDAHISFLQGIQAGYKPEDSAKLYLIPKLEKWQGASAFAKENDPLVADKIGALGEVQDGANPQSVIQSHPAKIFADPKFEARFETAAHEAERERLKAAKKINDDQTAAETQPTPEELTKQLFSLAAGKKRFDQDAPIQQYFGQRMGEIEQQLTNAPSETAPRVERVPPLGQSGRYVPQPPPELTDADLVQQQHPNWTPDQVRLGVQGKLKGAITMPEVGEVRKGYRFKGGNPAQKTSWESVEQ